MKLLLSSIATAVCTSTLALSMVLVPSNAPISGPLHQSQDQTPVETCTESNGSTKCCTPCGNGKTCCVTIGPIG